MARLEKEAVIKEEYGLKNKKELWKMESKLRSYKKQAKQLAARTDPQSEKEKQQLFASLFRMGLIEGEAKLDNILDLDLRDVLNRRLQTQVLRKGLARTIDQARQMVVHEHVMVNGKKIDAPSYLVLRDEEDKISFAPDSSFLNVDHPERIVQPKESKSAAVTPKARAIPRVEKKTIRIKIPEKAEAVEKPIEVVA